MGGLLGDIFGSKPDVPDLPKLELGDLQQKAIANNQAALPGAQKLVGQTNLFNAEQIDAMLARTTPNLASIRNNISSNIADWTAGKVPADVQELIQNNAAAKALGGGFAGSGAHGSLVARDLGRTSMDLMSKGQSAAESWLRTSAALYEPSMLSLQSMFISPSQQAQFDVNERDLQFQHQYLKNQIAAMPDPVMSGINAEVMSLLSAYLSKGGGMTKMSDYTQKTPGDNISFGDYQTDQAYAGMLGQ